MMVEWVASGGAELRELSLWFFFFLENVSTHWMSYNPDSHVKEKTEEGATGATVWRVLASAPRLHQMIF